MKFMKYFIKLLFILLMISIFCSNVNAEVKWNYIRSPKYKTELVKEYKKIPLSVRELFDDNDIKIKVYGYNRFPNYAGLYNGNIYIESYNVSWLRDFYNRRGVYPKLSNKNLSINYAKSTLIHELGHALDYGKGKISHKNDFVKIYKAEKKKIVKTSYYKYPMGKIKANINSPQEYFASSFDMYIRSPKDLKKHCPKTYKYFKVLFSN
ncbi:MAG: hypothetical protein IKR57_04760 [Bacilli bacterium]|nr:hypothetical protein [Bacilli bacterium]